MNGLVKIQEKDGQQLVSARDLHIFLEVGTQFTIWAERMIDFGFTENVDFNLIKNDEVRFEGTRKVSRTVYDYALTLDTAKQIAMLAKSLKGKEAREYFIECEKKLYQPKVLTRKEMAYAVIAAEEALEAAEAAKALAEAQVKELAPAAEYTKVVLTSTSTFRTTQIALELNMTAIKLNTILAEKGVQRKVNKQWCLNAKYLDKGYTDTSTFSYLRSDDSTGTSLSMLWTEVGRKFIHDLLNPNLLKSLKTIDE